VGKKWFCGFTTAQEINHYLNNGWVKQHVAQQITTEIVEVSDTFK